MTLPWPARLVAVAGLLATSHPWAAQSSSPKPGVSPQTLSLPSGAGSIEGLGESFEPQLNSGTFVYRIPLKLPPMRQGAAPSLALEYNSGSGNGMLGLGWRLPLPEIRRQTDRGLPQYTDGDTFSDWTGEELVRLAEGTFRCENEGLFARFQRTEDHWTATLPSGTRLVFGQTAQARLNRLASQTYCWKLEWSEDLNGNRIAYRYTNHLGQLYPREIEYGLHATEASGTLRVVFDYADDRPDAIVDYRPRFRSETRLRLVGVTVLLGERRLRHWRLGYAPGGTVSLLTTVTMFGDERSRLDGTARVNRDFLPPTRLEYTPALQSGFWRFTTNRLDVTPHFASGDAEFADLNRDGLPDLVYELNDTWYSALNQGGGQPFAASEHIANVTAGIHLNQVGTRLVDLTGDGAVQLLAQLDGDAGYFFRGFVTPHRLGPPVDFSFDMGDFRLDHPDLQFLDANHDKAVDVMRTFEDGPALLLNRALGPQAGREGDFYLPPGDPSMTAVQFSRGWQLADMNGDRLLDLVLFGTAEDGGTQVRLTRGMGEFEGPFAMAGGPVNALLGPRGEAGFHFVDADQDGLSDLAQVESGSVRVWLNGDGRSWLAPLVITEGIPEVQGGETTVRFLDLNGSGSTDIVWHQPGTAQLVALELHPAAKPHQLRWVTTGMGWGLEITYRSSTDDLLAAAGSTNAWTSPLPFPVQVIGAIEETDGLGGRTRSEFTYGNGYYDGDKKEFRGFARVMRRDQGDPGDGAPTLVTDYVFDTGDRDQVLKGKPLVVETRTESGAVFQRELSQWTGRRLPLDPAANESREVRFAERRTVTTEVREGLPAGQAVTLLQEYDYDDFGNPTCEANDGIVTGDDPSYADDERLTATDYAVNTNAWILRLPARQEIRDEHGEVLSRTEFFYDDETHSGENPGIAVRGNLTLKREWLSPSSSPATLASVRTRYDAYGNPVAVLDPLASAPGGAADFNQGHARQIAYDTQLHTHPVTETIHLGQGSAPLVFQASYDNGLGTVTRSTDFNTNSTTYGYDTFARLSTIVKPGDTPAHPTVEYDYALAVPADYWTADGLTRREGLVNYVETRLRDTSEAQSSKSEMYWFSREFVDGLGRTRLVKTEAEPAEGNTAPRVAVSQATRFNLRQKPAHVLNPFFSLQGGTLEELLAYEATEAPGWQGLFHQEGRLVALSRADAPATRTDYDAILRPVRATNADGTFRRTVYEPLRTRSYDENQTDPASRYFGAAMVHANDGLGRLVQVDEITRLNDDGTSASNLRAWTTRYAYDLNDQLTAIVDSQNNRKTFAYDGLRRKVHLNDPDRGVMDFVYDDASNLIETTDAKGQRITYTYDGANRLRTEHYHDGLPPPSWRVPALTSPHSTNSVVYHYDVPRADVLQGDNTLATARNVKGALAWVEDLSGEEHTSYDARGRVEWVVKRIPDPQLTAEFGLRNSDLVSYKTSFIYDSLDRLTGLVYPDLDALRYEYNARSLLSRIPGSASGAILSNMVYAPSGQIGRLDYGNGVRTTYAYDSRLRLNNLLTVSPPSTLNRQLIHFQYDFDGASNIESIEDRRPGSDVPAGDPRRNTQLFQYDDLYRLTRAQYSFELPGQPQRNDGEIRYRYDRIGNMLAQTSTLDHEDKGLPVANLGEMDSGGAAGRWNRTGRAANDEPGPHALTAIRHAPLATRRYPYDANGNMLDIDGLACTWDFKDRLVTVENAEMRAAYTYDYTDRRITKRVEYKPGVTNHGSHVTTLYVNKYFEVREHDAPTKYVWNGNTRVARVTGSLNTDIRVQRLRVYPGWNLCSLAVTANNALQQLSGRASGLVSLQAAVRWDPADKAWVEVHDNVTLPAGTVLWLQATTNATLILTGTYTPPKDRTVDACGDFLPSAGLESWNLPFDHSDSPSVTLWTYDAAATRWLSRLPPPLDAPSAVPAFLAPGEAVFARSEAAATLAVPEHALRIRYYHQDHLGTSTTLSDTDGGIIVQSASYCFGRARIVDEPRGVSESYGFTQKEQDVESGIVYFESRFLHPVLGAFIQVDSRATSIPNHWTPEPQKLNPYGYCSHRPLVFVDPDGCDQKYRDGLQPMFEKGGFHAVGALVLATLDRTAEHVEKAVEQTKPVVRMIPEMLKPEFWKKTEELGDKVLDANDWAKKGVEIADEKQTDQERGFTVLESVGKLAEKLLPGVGKTINEITQMGTGSGRNYIRIQDKYLSEQRERVDSILSDDKHGLGGQQAGDKPAAQGEQ